MKKIPAETRKKFVEMRQGGFSVRDISRRLGFSYQTGRNFEKARKAGTLQDEILESEEPLETKSVKNVIRKCLAALQSREIEDLSTNEIVAILSKSLTALNRLNQSGEGQEEDELDKIYRELKQETES